MKVLILGGGGREHALARKLKQEGHEVIAAPGNPGIAELGECVSLEICNPQVVADFVRTRNIEFTVVGPEAPLAAGIVDYFNVLDLPIFGPTKAAAEIETSKALCCNLLHRHGVPIPPTTYYGSFGDMKLRALSRSLPFVMKKSGLASGKGAEVVSNQQDLESALGRLEKMPDGEFLIQDMMTGPEMSFFVLTDGFDFRFIGSAQDYKPLYAGGPNTGGMGGFAPHYLLTRSMREIIENRIGRPTIMALQQEQRAYQGVMYFQLMLTPMGPVVIEINCRFGDPEAQLLVPLLDCDLLELLQATTKPGFLRFFEPKFMPMTKAVGIVLASRGYPGKPDDGYVITGPEGVDGSLNPHHYAHVFQAGTKRDGEGQLITSGGRVITVVGTGFSYRQAKEFAERAANLISFDGKYRREDIANEAITEELAK